MMTSTGLLRRQRFDRIARRRCGRSRCAELVSDAEADGPDFILEYVLGPDASGIEQLDGITYYTPEEVVRRWRGRIDIDTLANWRSKKQGPPFHRFSGRAILYRVDLLARWEANQMFACDLLSVVEQEGRSVYPRVRLTAKLASLLRVRIRGKVMSLITTGWSKIGEWIGFLLALLTALFVFLTILIFFVGFYFFLLILAASLVAAIIGGPPGGALGIGADMVELEFWITVWAWMLIVYIAAVAIILILTVAGILIDSAFNFFANVFKPGVNAWNSLGSDLANGFGRCFGGISDGISWTVHKLKDAYNWGKDEATIGYAKAKGYINEIWGKIWGN
jgi:hypothetical protein